MQKKQATAAETAIADAMELIISLELPYLEQLHIELGKHIVMRKQREQAETVTKIRQLAAEAGIDLKELANYTPPKPVTTRKTSGKVYVNPVNGASWSGAGRRPKWVLEALASGKNIEDLLFPQ